MEFIAKDAFFSDKSLDLMEAKPVLSGSTIEWVARDGDGLTEADRQLLRVKHRSRDVNFARAAEVKSLMNQGRKCMEIVQLLHKRYGRTMVKRDHAALSGRGGRKKARI